MSNMANNMQLVVNIAKEYTEQLTSSKVIELFEAYNCWHGIYFYLGARIAFTEVGVQWSITCLAWRRGATHVLLRWLSSLRSVA